MNLTPNPPPRRQRGVSLLGLLFWAIVVGGTVLLGLRVVPSVNEYLTIQKAVDKVAAEGLATVPEIRAAFDRQKDIEYSIKTISGKDLKVTKEDEKVVISYAYDSEVELVAPIYLLIKYEGRSKPQR